MKADEGEEGEGEVGGLFRLTGGAGGRERVRRGVMDMVDSSRFTTATAQDWQLDTVGDGREREYSRNQLNTPVHVL